MTLFDVLKKNRIDFEEPLLIQKVQEFAEANILSALCFIDSFREPSHPIYFKIVQNCFEYVRDKLCATPESKLYQASCLCLI